ncbi:5'-nucleotidase [Bradyrhizobium algeriense]|uniref:5'-nucleotidase SurE n=1 Tax=Bradyrhizobium algeriense TaxID=634784 RepID=A0ABU8BB89_9BRAD
MRILCTNDDGIHAPGLKIVEEIARALSDDVWIVAPELDQSGVSHSLSLNDPLRLREVGPRHFAVRGTPTDCVIMGSRHILGEKMPDLVLSGVNKGRNVAEDVVYSGTIAGALEGTILGIPSFALSQEFSIETRHAPLWDTALKLGPDILRKVIDAGVPKNTVINVNFPRLHARPGQGRARDASRQAQPRLPQSRQAPRWPRQSLFLDRLRARGDDGHAGRRHRSGRTCGALRIGHAAAARSDR